MTINLAGDLISTVVDAAHYSPRNRQASIGPSELGHPCARRLAYKITGQPRRWRDSDPWASIVGTAVHAWLADAFSAANLSLDEPRWLTEQRLFATPEIPGSCDLYDCHTDTVIDHKVVGVETLTKAKRGGPSEQYRVQCHVYGLGWERLGRTPREVAIAYWPRSGFLSGLHLHREPYDGAIARSALDRLTNITRAAQTLGVATDPASINLIPCLPGDECRYCPYQSKVAGDGGCPDAPKKQAMSPIAGI